MRLLSSRDVYLVLAVWADIQGGVVKDWKSASKIVKCLQSDVGGWNEWDRSRKIKWLNRFLSWLWSNGNTLQNGWKKVVNFVYDDRISNGVDEVIDEYNRYIRERFGKEIEVNTANSEVIKAVRVLQKIAKERGVSVYEIVKMQHECWEKIDRPLVFERMSNERIVRRRLEVKSDMDSKAGVVVKRSNISSGSSNNQMESELRNWWNTVLKVGIAPYIDKKGWIGKVAKEMWNELMNTETKEEKMKVLREYSVDKVVEKWKKEGYPDFKEVN
jgi:hypothetical protein